MTKKSSKKVLIWNTFPLLERAGGPSTYLYHLKEYFDRNEEVEVSFLTESINVEKVKKTTSKKSLIPKIIRNIVRVNQNLKNNLNRYNTSIESDFNLNDFEAIHFHTTVDLFQAIPQLKKYNGKVLLTSHTPMAPHLEHIGDSLPLYLIKPKIKKDYKSIDKKAFERADVLVFPSPEALEPYFKTWNDFKEIIENKNIKYVPTGVKAAKPKKTKGLIFKELNIPENAIVICYAGRHNKVKGYDLLKEFGKSILEKNPNIYFVVLGKEYPIKGLSHERWIEVGWTTDPASYIKASSLFVLPNRQTYFDLILLEVLSLGKRCLLSETGGNKFFKQIAGNGFSYFESENLASMITTFNQIDFSKTHEEELFNLYQSDFTEKRFGENMTAMYKELL